MTDNRTTELLPCPFCGGEAEYRKPFNDGRAGIKAGCPACGIWTRVHRSYACAAAAWNARVTDGALTAEQVRSVLLIHLPHREYYSVEQTEAWQAIADELNARAERTCRNTSDNNYFRCSVCQKKTYRSEETFNYCPNCGARVIGTEAGE